MRIKYKDAYDYWTKPQCCQLSDFVAIFSYFSDPFGDFFSKQRQATNLASFSAAIGDFWRLFEVKALALTRVTMTHWFCELGQSVCVWREVWSRSNSAI